MPIYEYRCAACGHHLEALQKMSEGPLRKCPDCGKSQLKRLVSAPQFRLKGSGWYETDFKNKNETQAQPRREGRCRIERSGQRQIDGHVGQGRSRQGRRRGEERRCLGPYAQAERADERVDEGAEQDGA